MVAVKNSPTSRPSERRVASFRQRLREMDDGPYLLSLIAYHAAPTLAGIKPAALFRPDGAGRNLETALIACSGTLRQSFGMEVESLGKRAGTDSLLLFVYDPGLLGKALSQPEAATLLAAAGYGVLSGRLGDCLGCLRQKCAGPGFPHEIGVFLGYPPGDVRRFMSGVEPEGGDASLGWRIFGDREKARRMSGRYQLTKSLAARLMAGGREWNEMALILRSRARKIGWLGDEKNGDKKGGES
jgi:hypothetical protein